MSTISATQRPDAYVADNGNGTFDAFVKGKGFAANRTLADALAFIRENTGRSSGAVAVWERENSDWGSELDLDPKA